MNTESLLYKRAFSAGIDAVIAVMLYAATYRSAQLLHLPHQTIIAYANCYLATIVIPVFVWYGQSVGQKVMGLKVIVNGSDKKSKGIIFLCELCKAILFTDLNLLTLAAFLAFPLLNKSHCTLHDLITGTRVVQISSEKPSKFV